MGVLNFCGKVKFRSSEEFEKLRGLAIEEIVLGRLRREPHGVSSLEMWESMEIVGVAM